MYKEGHKIIYEEGDIVGPHNIVFIEEIEPNNNGYRQAKFRCGVCNKDFIGIINSVKYGKKTSCGCQLNQSKKGKYKYNIGDYVGPNKIKLVERLYSNGKEWICSFECPKCHKNFSNILSRITHKNSKVQSCSDCAGRKYFKGMYIGINNNIQILSDPQIDKNTHHAKAYFKCTECNKMFYTSCTAMNKKEESLCSSCMRTIHKENNYIGTLGFFFVKRTAINKGIFKCPHCKENHIHEISAVANDRLKSCGCLDRVPLPEKGTQFNYWTFLKEGTKTGYWLCQCQCGTIKEVRNLNIRNGTSLSCGCINISKGELKIQEILRNLNIKFITQYRFSECKNIKALPFDFYLPQYHYCIEYDGEHHFQIKEHFGGKESFQYRQHNDEIKNQYCKDNNIKLIRIPYWDYDKLNEEYLLSLINDIENV